MNEFLGADLASSLSGIFERMEQAEEEIDRAMRRHPKFADRIYHSFSLLTPQHDRMATEFVYRSHCRELLDRVAAGQDTRPGTAAEVCCACSEASMLAPLTTTAAGLYARMWTVAFPEQRNVWSDQGEHYEALRGTQIDDLEREARHKTRQDDRKLGTIECGGMHHGETVACEYAPKAADVQLAMIA